MNQSNKIIHSKINFGVVDIYLIIFECSISTYIFLFYINFIKLEGDRRKRLRALSPFIHHSKDNAVDGKNKQTICLYVICHKTMADRPEVRLTLRLP